MSRQMQISAAEVTSICLTILTAMAVTVTMMYLRSILVPLTLSIFVYLMITPLIEKLEKCYKMPSIVATLTLFCAAVLFVFLIGILVNISIRDFIASSAQYQTQYDQLIINVESLAATFGGEVDLSKIKDQFKPMSLFKMVSGLTSNALGLLGNILLMSLFLIFMLVSRNPLTKISPLAEQIRNTVSRYIWTKVLISSLTGVLVSFFLWMIGVDLALMFGVLAFLLNFIPSIGSIVATLLPIPIALLQFGLGINVVLAILLPLSAQLAIGNVLEPKLMGQSLDLHPITLMVFLLFWGIVWGAAGMFLAVPITSVVKIVLAKFDRTVFLADLMAGRFSFSLEPNVERS